MGNAVAQAKVPFAECANCSRYEGVLVPPEAVAGAEVLVVGEAPGASERVEGKPFVGRSGQLLRATLAQLGLKGVYFTNACLCHTEKTPTPMELDCCRERLVQEIKAARPKVVVLAGAAAVHALIGNEGVTALQGMLLQWVDSRDGFEVAVVPCFHPAAVLRRPELFQDFADALDKCKRYLLGQSLIDVQPDSFGKVRLGSNRVKADAFLTTLKSVPSKVSVDIETSGYNPYKDRILCLGLAARVDGAVRRYAIPWEEVDKHLLQELLHSKSLVFYNGEFDVQFLKSEGLDAAIGDDVILQHYLVDTRPNALGLKHGARKYLNAPDWEEDLKQYLPTRQTSFEEVPMEILLNYTSLDAAYTLVLGEQLPTYMDSDDKWVYEHILVPAANMFVHCSRVGIRVDVHRLEQLKAEYTSRLQVLSDKLAEIAGLPAFNPRSVRDCRALLYDVLKLNPVDGTYSTGREVLDYYSRVEAVQLLKEFREKAKILGTYLEGLLDDLVAHQEGGRTVFRVHPNLKLFGTTTGRISSNNPNMLGLPKEKGGIRRLFVADEGKLLVMMDFKQMELRVAAALSGDENMRRDFEGGRDFHGEARKRLFGEKEKYTHQEVLDAKTIIFGPLYGRGLPSLARQLGCSLREAQEYMSRVLGPYKTFMAWSDRQAEEARSTGEVRSYFGRKRRWGLITDDNIKDVEHEARNHPVSSTASDVNLLTMLKIYHTFDHDLVMPLLPIHDAILMSVDEHKAEGLLRDVEHIAVTYPQELLQTSVPFAVEITVGKEWL